MVTIPRRPRDERVEGANEDQREPSTGIHPFIAVLPGTIPGVGGGTVRDMFLAQVPSILRSDIYATAALAGAICLVGAQSGDVSHGSGVSRWHGLFCLAPRSAVAAMESSQSRSVDGGRLSGGRGCWYGFALAARASTALQASSKVRADDSPKDERLLLCKQMARMEELHRQSIPTAVSY